MRHDVAAERVVGRQPAQLRQHLVAAHIVSPGGGHGALEGAGVVLGVAGGGHALDAAEFGQGVDAVRLEGFD